MAKRKTQYETEVRLALLAIVFVLVFLNFISLFIIYRARIAKHGESLLSLRSAAVSISLVLQNDRPEGFTPDTRDSLEMSYDLAGLYVLPPRPTTDSLAQRRSWFTRVASELPRNRLSEFAGKLIDAELHTLTRGPGSEYFYLYPVISHRPERLLVVSRDIPALAFLDDTGKTILIIGLLALTAVIIVHMVLYRSIFAPFRELHEKAALVGRPVGDGPVDAAAVIAEYETIIDELKDNRSKLERLNEEISARADSIEEFNQYLLRSIDSGMITLAIDGRVQTLNEAAGRILDVDPSDQRYRTYAEIFDTNEDLIDSIRQALQEDDVPGYREYHVRTGEGRTVVIGVTFSRIRGRDDTTLGMSILMTDLTELSHLRREVETRNRLASLGEMAGGLAHQMRNALGVISGYGRLARKQLEKLNQPPEAAVALLQETGEAEAMISQFLNFARPLELNPSWIEMNDFVQGIVDSYAVRKDSPNAEISIERDVPCHIQADPLLLKQALINLIDNAVQAFDCRTGLVEVSISRGGDSVEIAVTDSGPGIDPDTLDQIFTPFYSSRALGTGLGLPLVKKIVDLHLGRIIVDSEPGRGTTFSLLLPAGKRAVSESPTS